MFWSKAILSLTFITLCISSAQPELLIIRCDGNNIKPINSDDKNATQIWSIVKRYQWPTSINYADDLSAQEKNTIYSPGKGNNEEKVIRSKIKNIDPVYDNIFVPTTLYELFFLLKYYSTTDASNIKHLIGSTSYDFGPTLDLDIRNTLEESNTLNLKTIYDRRFNNGDLDQMKSIINEELFNYIQKHTPSVFKENNNTLITNALQQCAYELAEGLIKALPKHVLKIASREIKAESNKLDLMGTVAKTIDLEYQARETNQALLFRGSDGVRQCVSLDPTNTTRFAKLLDSPLVPSYDDTFSQAYNKQSFIPYSLSFGNSLFAGALFDIGACAYYYVGDSAYGYAFSINKYDYATTQCNNLFFVSPLPTLAGLCGCGEFFHSRSKAAIPSKSILSWLTSQSYYDVKGIAGKSYYDSCNFLLINRNPIEHASLLSTYFIQNLNLIKANVANPSNILDAHKKAALMYQNIIAA